MRYHLNALQFIDENAQALNLRECIRVSLNAKFRMCSLEMFGKFLYCTDQRSDSLARI